jgi:hypothetical protein
MRAIQEEERKWLGAVTIDSGLGRGWVSGKGGYQERMVSEQDE